MLTLTIVTPELSLAAVTCDHVTFTSVDGQLGIRTGHASVVGMLVGGFVHPKRAGKTLECVAVRGGVGQVAGNQVLIITEAAVPASKVNRSAVEAKLAALAESPDTAVERAFLRAQLTLPATEMSTDEMLAGARAAIDAQ